MSHVLPAPTVRLTLWWTYWTVLAAADLIAQLAVGLYRIVRPLVRLAQAYLREVPFHRTRRLGFWGAHVTRHVDRRRRQSVWWSGRLAWKTWGEV